MTNFNIPNPEENNTDDSRLAALVTYHVIQECVNTAQYPDTACEEGVRLADKIYPGISNEIEKIRNNAGDTIV